MHANFCAMITDGVEKERIGIHHLFKTLSKLSEIMLILPCQNLVKNLWKSVSSWETTI